jgi:hypothetical protein
VPSALGSVHRRPKKQKESAHEHSCESVGGGAQGKIPGQSEGTGQWQETRGRKEAAKEGHKCASDSRGWSPARMSHFAVKSH